MQLNPNEIVELVEALPEFRPIVEALVKEAKEFYLPMAKQAADYLIDEASDKRIEVFNKFIKAGLAHDTALTLTLHTFDSVKGSLQSLQQNKGAK